MEDGVTGWRFVSTYNYHHGYFDGVEREFRGFGRAISATPSRSREATSSTSRRFW